MSAPGNDNPAAEPAPRQEEPLSTPPPPSGPPLGRDSQHSNETPVPESTIPPPHNPSNNPIFSPSPTNPSDSDICEVTQVKEHAPQSPPPEQRRQKKEQQVKTKSGWGRRLSGWGSKAASPFNALTNKMGSETFLPTTMDKECDKAARILKCFCQDGISVEDDEVPAGASPNTTSDKATTDKPRGKSIFTIPSKVINRAQGLAIFTTFRAGFHVTGGSGSGVLIARMPDGSWSPPSGIQVHSVGAGFVVGIDIYDCVLVINTKEALEAFMRTRMSLGSDLAMTAGPWGAGGALEWGIPQGQSKEKTVEGEPSQPGESGAPGVSTTATAAPAPAPSSLPAPSPTPEQPAQDGKDDEGKWSGDSLRPVYSYIKSRGFYAGVQIDGTVVAERKDANAAFYGAPVPVRSILEGEVPLVPSHANWPATVRGLFEVLDGAEGWHGQQREEASPLPPTPAADVPIAATVVPVETTDVPDETTGLPVETTAVQVETTDVPAETRELPDATTDVRGATSDVPDETTGLSVETTGLSVETTDVPVETTDVPVATKDLPVATTDLPAATTDLPVATPGLPDETTSLPVEITDVPVETTDVPVATKDVPAATTSVPVETIELPVETTDLPVATPDLSDETTGLPVETTDVPVETTNVPAATTKVPAATKGVTAKTTGVTAKATDVPVATIDLAAASRGLRKVSLGTKSATKVLPPSRPGRSASVAERVKAMEAALAASLQASLQAKYTSSAPPSYSEKADTRGQPPAYVANGVSVSQY